jgi:hypothetical protein
MGHAINQLLGNWDFLWRDVADFDHDKILPYGHYNHSALRL